MQFLVIILGFLYGLVQFNQIYLGLSFAIFFLLIFRIVFKSNEIFVFREWALALYSINYLIAPAITYSLPPDQVLYAMKIDIDAYYNLAFFGFIFFAIGMFSLKTIVFSLDYKNINNLAIVNKDFLIKATILGVFLRTILPLIPGEIGFFIYLFATLRFVGAFALLAVSNRLWYYSALVLFLELIAAFLQGMYHDAIMWIIFFGLFYLYIIKPSFQVKLIGVLAAIVLIFFIQAIKFAYRERVWQEGQEASISTVMYVGSSQISQEGLFGTENLLSTLNRGNQAWIFASTVENMDRNKNFQQLTNVNKYLEAALLPRFLAPNKLKSGDKEIFNEYSGHTINEGTSMGLGVFADGYIAYGTGGVYIFGFILGLIFSLTFKIVERWTKVSPFYVLLLLPLLNYAVRPDCELQTTINHLFKGILVFGAVVYFTRKRFNIDSQENRSKLLHLNLVTTKK